ncbi:MAG: 50S ribosomal protein L9 [Candidatus Omnitrophica bacterium]|nr:50S ribosomal protein L9 [Candidatus Omnitrophota bacterium]
MEVILLKDVEKLGKRGEVVAVRDGFGRNFLIPRSLALPATRVNKAFLEAEKKHASVRKTHKKEDAAKLAERIATLVLRLPVSVGEKDKLFGSITAQDLAEALKREGISIDKKQFRLEEPIRSLGAHKVTIDLEREVKATLQVEVIKK